MAVHSTLHRPLVHRAQLSRETLAYGWPHRVAAVLIALVGGVFVTVTLTANLFHVGPAFDRMTGGFRPLMTQQALQTDRQDIAALSKAGTEINAKMLPALAQQLGMSPGQLSTMLASQYPAVDAGLKALPVITPRFDSLVNLLDQQRPYFSAADAIPTKSIPAASVPWSLLAVGLIALGLGAWLWFNPRGAAMIAAGVGALLIATPLILTMPHKASYADTLNTHLKPVYNQQLIDQSGSALTTLGAMGTEMQQKMLPDMAAQLKMTPAQLNLMFAQSFPDTSTALAGLPQSMGRFHTMVATFDKHLSDYKVLKPVSFVPIVWVMLGGGIALLVLGGAGVVITSARKAS